VPEKAATMIASELGVSNAPAAPCNGRAAINSSNGESPPRASEAGWVRCHRRGEYSASMSVFARIVVGVDGTEWGLEALRQALVLAPADGSEIHAITAVYTGPAFRTGFEAAHWVEMLEQEAGEAREAAAAILDGRPNSDAKVVRGEPLHVLRQARDEAGATLLALGGRHSSRFLGIMLGDIGTELLHDGICSVLVARPQTGQEWEPRGIVVGLDGSDPALAALGTTDEIAARLGAEIEIVCATGGKPVRDEGTWANRVDNWDAEKPVAALVRRSHHANLVVVGSRGLHGLRSLGSVSEQVAHQARCSVLVVHQ
jgi:nucleotide-binding universal stress UspA family protein